MVVAVGDEAQRQGDACEHQRPGVQVGDRAPVGEADSRHAMVEVLAVGTVDRLLVLQPLEDDERAIQERHREQDQGQHERHDGRGLDGCLDCDHAHQQAEQIRSAVAHEAGCRREVEDQEAQCGPRRDRGEHPRRLTVEVVGDHRHRAGHDHAHARGEAVDAVGEVDDVHHRDEADHGQHRARVGCARVRELQVPDERQRDRLHGDAVVDDDHGRHDLPDQLRERMQVEAVVDRADGDDHGRREQQAAPDLVRFPVSGGQPHQHRDQHAGEDREAAQQRRVAVREPRSRGLSTAPRARARRIVNGVIAAATASAATKARSASSSDGCAIGCTQHRRPGSRQRRRTDRRGGPRPRARHRRGGVGPAARVDAGRGSRSTAPRPTGEAVTIETPALRV